jgi:type IV secretory pathway TraG/TraD family ATPase VirD4
MIPQVGQVGLPGPGDVLRAIVGELPAVSNEVLMAGGVGVFVALALGHRIVFGALARVGAWAAAREGYALPVSIRETRGRAIGRLARWGNVLSIPRTGSILALGASRSGKTEAAKHVVDQMRADEDEPMIVYDHKEDYQQFLEASGQSYVTLSSRDSDVTWNVFREIDEESDADEIARAIFADAGESYFDVAGRQVFAAVLKHLYREGERHDEAPSNHNLVNFFERRGREAVYEDLHTDANGDLTGAASHLDPESSRQASGVFASVQQRVNDVFVGDFAAEPTDDRPAISIREHMHDPQGRALVLDYPYREGKTTTPLFRLLVDLAAREALDEGDRGSYFILDEVAQVPALSRLDELVNVGAGRNVQVLVTLQSVAQLREGYGRDGAEAILSGFLSAVLLRCGDDPSVEFARSRIGTEFKQRTANVEKTSPRSDGRQKTIRRETRQDEEYPFAKGEITEWRPGEGVVVRSDSWAHGRIQLLDG